MFKTNRAFTLIELLVVIAIIAILAAILFPVFAQAREKARQTICLSNVKQLGLGVMMYMQDFDETVPIGGYWVDSSPTGESRWYWDVQPYMKSQMIRQCPSSRFARNITPANKWDSNYGLNSNLSGWAQWANVKSNAAITVPADTILFTEADTVKVSWLSAPSIPMSVITDSTKWANVGTWSCDWDVSPPDQWDYNATWAGGRGYDPAYFITDWKRVPIPRHSGGANVAYCDGHAKWMRIERITGVGQQGTTQAGVREARPMGWNYGDSENQWDNL